MRKLIRSRLVFVFYVAFTVVTATALSPTRAVGDTPVYLPKGAVDGVTLIGPPAAKDSADFKEQMAIVMWLQKSRTPEQVAFVSEELDIGRFVPIIGEQLFSVDGALLKEVVDIAIAQVRADYDAVKAVYDVPRPFQVNPDVKPVGQDVRPVASYPSGHAIRATVYARLLADVFPDEKDRLMALAEQIGYGRVIAGVHYPEDIVTGFELGNAYADVIIEQPAYKDALTRLREAEPLMDAAQ